MEAFDGEVVMKKKDNGPTLYNTPYECCGCSACASSCPVNAIHMCADKEGFLYPHVDHKKCISCKLCEQVCPLKNNEPERTEPLEIFAVKNSDLAKRMQSASGGAFSLFAEWMESQDGIIYGAAYDQTFRVCHQRAEGAGAWKKFCTSKYVQSSIGDCFVQVKEDLDAGLPVLFSGTPCQIQGLKYFLRNTNTDKLLTCDLICRAVPSPLIWEEWLHMMQEQIKSPIDEINFREKEGTGWHNSSLTIKGKDGEILYTGTHNKNAFSRIFFKGLSMRPSCFHCKYSSLKRYGDITLGDYWGVESNFPEFDDNMGISLVMCNTEKGLTIWNRVFDKTESFSISKEQCIQPALQQPAEEPKGRKTFWKVYQGHGLNAALKVFRMAPLSSPVEKVIVKVYRGFLRAIDAL